MWIFDDASPIEVWWTWQNGVGAVVALFLCVDVISDARDRLLMAERGRRSATYLCLALVGSMVLAMLIYSMIGLVAMTQPAAVPGEVSPTQWAVTIGFGISSTVKVAICIVWRVMRFRLRREGVDPSLTVGKASTA